MASDHLEAKVSEKPGARVSTHLHLCFSSMEHESRLHRMGDSALKAGLATKIIYAGYRADGLPEAQVIEESQEVVRIGVRPAPPGSPRLIRALSEPMWRRAIIRRFASARMSLVVAHSLASLPAAVAVARRNGAGLLYDARELETEREGWSPFVRWLARGCERRLIRRCDHTIVVNDSIRAWYERAYPGVSVSTVRNAPVLPDQIGPSRLRASLGIAEEPLVYVYCGLLDHGRGLFELIEAFSGLGDDHQLVIIGFGPLEAKVREACARHANLHLHPAVRQSELISLMSGADVGAFLPTGRSLSYQNSLPNKVFEYAASGLALLVSDGPELARFASEHPLARSIPASVERIRETVRSWPVQELRRGRACMKYRPPSWQEEEKRLLEAFAIVGRRRSAAR